MNTYKATQIANYIIELAHERGDEITHLKLQKLLYYVQGIYLGVTGNPIFDEDICAWKFGPVVYSVFSFFKKYGKESIPKPINNHGLEEFDKAVVASIYDNFRKYTAAQLVDKTHDEPPFKYADDDVININEIKAYFSSAYADEKLFSNIPIVNILPKEDYDPTEDAEWAAYC